MDRPTDDSRALHRQLKALLSQARQNEQKMRRLQSQELRLLGAGSLRELIHMLLHDYPANFQLDVVSLFLVDPEYEIERLLEQEQFPPRQEPRLIFSTDAEDFDQPGALPLFPILGTYDVQKHASLFPGNETPLASVAILPLVRHGSFLGSLNLASRDRARFTDDSGTDLLERLAAIVAISIENTLNYERLKRTGLTDALTGINNRRFFDQRLQEEIERARRTEESLSCLFIDIDHFKQVNDNYGHQTGDRVLQQIAARIHGQMRRSDVLARYGGEEFAMLLTSTTAEEAVEIAERIRLNVSDYCVRIPERRDIRVTVSIGVAVTHPERDNTAGREAAELLIQRADTALLAAKDAGRNRVCVAQHDPAS